MTLTTPKPVCASQPFGPTSRALRRSRSNTWDDVRVGRSARKIAAAPATAGDENDVPSTLATSLGQIDCGTSDSTSTPGAARSIEPPRLEKLAGWSASSVAATDSTCG